MSCMWLKFGAIKYTFLLLYHGSSCIPLIVYRLHQFIVGTGCILIYLIVMNTICSLCHSLYMYNWTKPVNIRDIPWTAPASILVHSVFKTVFFQKNLHILLLTLLLLHSCEGLPRYCYSLECSFLPNEEPTCPWASV